MKVAKLREVLQEAPLEADMVYDLDGDPVLITGYSFATDRATGEVIAVVLDSNLLSEGV